MRPQSREPVELADDGLYGGTPFELALDLRRDAAALLAEGYVEEREFGIVYRFADGYIERLQKS